MIPARGMGGRRRLTRRGQRVRGIDRAVAVVAGFLLAWQVAGWIADGAARGIG